MLNFNLKKKCEIQDRLLSQSPCSAAYILVFDIV